MPFVVGASGYRFDTIVPLPAGSGQLPRNAPEPTTEARSRLQRLLGRLARRCEARPTVPATTPSGRFGKPPPGWVAVDGLANGSIDPDGTKHPGIWDEAISNPLYLTRVYRTPSTIAIDIGWRVIVAKKYRP